VCSSDLETIQESMQLKQLPLESNQVNQINRPLISPSNQNIEPFKENNFSNFNKNLNDFESRKSTITFNSEPSILEIENNSNDLDEIKLEDTIIFDNLDTDVPNL
jgi:hypothetical protein